VYIVNIVNVDEWSSEVDT